MEQKQTPYFLQILNSLAFCFSVWIELWRVHICKEFYYSIHPGKEKKRRQQPTYSLWSACQVCPIAGNPRCRILVLQVLPHTFHEFVCVGFSQRALVLQTFWNLYPYQDMHLQYIKHPRPFTEKVWAAFWAPVNYTFHHKYSAWFDPNHPWKACPWWKEKNIPMKNYFLLEHTWELSSTQNYSKEGRKARMQETILADFKKKDWSLTCTFYICQRQAGKSALSITEDLNIFFAVKFLISEVYWKVLQVLGGWIFHLLSKTLKRKTNYTPKSVHKTTMDLQIQNPWKKWVYK